MSTRHVGHIAQARTATATNTSAWLLKQITCTNIATAKQRLMSWRNQIFWNAITNKRINRIKAGGAEVWGAAIAQFLFQLIFQLGHPDVVLINFILKIIFVKVCQKYVMKIENKTTRQKSHKVSVTVLIQLYVQAKHLIHCYGCSILVKLEHEPDKNRKVQQKTQTNHTKGMQVEKPYYHATCA